MTVLSNINPKQRSPGGSSLSGRVPMAGDKASQERAWKITGSEAPHLHATDVGQWPRLDATHVPSWPPLQDPFLAGCLSGAAICKNQGLHSPGLNPNRRLSSAIVVSPVSAKELHPINFFLSEGRAQEDSRRGGGDGTRSAGVAIARQGGARCSRAGAAQARTGRSVLSSPASSENLGGSAEPSPDHGRICSRSEQPSPEHASPEEYSRSASANGRLLRRRRSRGKNLILEELRQWEMEEGKPSDQDAAEVAPAEYGRSKSDSGIPFRHLQKGGLGHQESSGAAQSTEYGRSISDSGLPAKRFQKKKNPILEELHKLEAAELCHPAGPLSLYDSMTITDDSKKVYSKYTKSVWYGGRVVERGVPWQPTETVGMEEEEDVAADAKAKAASCFVPRSRRQAQLKSRSWLERPSLALNTEMETRAARTPGCSADSSAHNPELRAWGQMIGDVRLSKSKGASHEVKKAQAQSPSRTAFDEGLSTSGGHDLRHVTGQVVLAGKHAEQEHTAKDKKAFGRRGSGKFDFRGSAWPRRLPGDEETPAQRQQSGLQQS